MFKTAAASPLATTSSVSFPDFLGKELITELTVQFNKLMTLLNGAIEFKVESAIIADTQSFLQNTESEKDAKSYQIMALAKIAQESSNSAILTCIARIFTSIKDPRKIMAAVRTAMDMQRGYSPAEVASFFAPLAQVVLEKGDFDARFEARLFWQQLATGGKSESLLLTETPDEKKASDVAIAAAATMEVQPGPTIVDKRTLSNELANVLTLAVDPRSGAPKADMIGAIQSLLQVSATSSESMRHEVFLRILGGAGRTVKLAEVTIRTDVEALRKESNADGRQRYQIKDELDVLCKRAGVAETLRHAENSSPLLERMVIQKKPADIKHHIIECLMVLAVLYTKEKEKNAGKLQCIARVFSQIDDPNVLIAITNDIILAVKELGSIGWPVANFANFAKFVQEYGDCEVIPEVADVWQKLANGIMPLSILEMPAAAVRAFPQPPVATYSRSAEASAATVTATVTVMAPEDTRSISLSN